MTIQIVVLTLLLLWLLYTEKKINDAEQELLDAIGKLIDKYKAESEDKGRKENDE